VARRAIGTFGVVWSAVYKRRWPLQAVGDGVIVGLFFIGLVTAGAPSIDSAKVRDRYLSRGSSTRSVAPFQKVSLVGKDVIAGSTLTATRYRLVL